MSVPQPGFGHCTGTGTVPPAPADVPGAQSYQSDPLPNLIASNSRAYAEIQRYIISVLRQRPVIPYCKYSFKLPK